MEDNPTKLAICIFLYICSMFSAMAQNTRMYPENVNVSVGVVLDLKTLGGKVGLSCIQMGLSDYYLSHSYYKTRLLLHPMDSNSDVIGAAAAALHLIQKMGVQALIGPNSSMQANFVINLGERAEVPIVTFTASSPSLASIRSKYFIRAAQNDSTQVKAISAIVHAFGWREAVPIYVDNAFGEGIIPYLTDALQEVDARVPYRSAIPPDSSDDEIEDELRKLMTMQTRVFIVHMLPHLGSRLFIKAKEIGMMKAGYVWIMTDGIANEISAIDPAVLDSMQGVLCVKTYVPKTKELQSFRARWKTKFQQDNPTIVDAELDIFGLWAHDAAVTLARAVEKAANANIAFEMTNSSGSTKTCLDTFVASENAPRLLQALSNSHYRGLSGDFSLVNGQLQSSTFHIYNIIGNGWKGAGFWTPKSGLIMQLNLSRRSMHSSSRADLATIIWPGDSTSVPKGWEIPTNEKKLRIGVPWKEGFGEFVKVTRDPVTNTTSVTGFCIDVFNAVKEVLPYALPCEFIPFENAKGESAGTYNDLIYQVYLQNLDAVVGDTTIVANRSQYVDFTLPYTESGVSMIVPIGDKNRKSAAWLFLKPLTWELWVTSGCFFVFIGFIVWVLEHRVNPEFGGSTSNQVGTVFWVSFSTMVFAIREKIMNNLTKFVIIVWYFVVLVLTQSYTASLSSTLTTEKLQPIVTDVKLLIKNGKYVGYQKDSFVFEILKKLGFDESRLRAYKTVEECHELFMKGSGNEGISAAFDEAPYTKIFIAQYCLQYTAIEPTFKTDGFGFVFPKGSPLVADVSRAILNVTEGDKMMEIERTWLAPKTSCPDPASTLIPSNSLGLESFGGLFIVAGVAAMLALIMFLVLFLYDQWDVIMTINSGPNASTWTQKFKVLWGKFGERDHSSRGFRNASNPASPEQAPPGSDQRPSTDLRDSNPQTSPQTQIQQAPPPPASVQRPSTELAAQPSPQPALTIELACPNQERPQTSHEWHCEIKL